MNKMTMEKIIIKKAESILNTTLDMYEGKVISPDMLRAIAELITAIDTTRRD